MDFFQKKSNYIIFFLALFSCEIVFSQISNFTFTVTATAETCTANGCLNFSVSNTISGSTILYSVYQLPNTTTPITVTSSNQFCGLVSGTYRVIATQSLGNQSGSQQQDVNIQNQITPLSYFIDSTNEVCSHDATLTVNTISGNAQQYQILSGPVTAPLQSSNVFTGLTAGVYQIRVFDDCGEGVVQTHTIEASNSNLIFNTNTASMIGCNNVGIGFSFTREDQLQGIIVYPIQVQTIVNPPSGASIVFNTTLNNPLTAFSQTIPYYSNQPYSYSFIITDGCGVSYTLNGTVNGLSPQATYTLEDDDCTHKNLLISNISSALLVSAPSTYPVTTPYNFTSQIQVGSLNLLHLPEGTYVFNVTNACGANQTLTVVIDVPDNNPYYVVYNVNCSMGSIKIFYVTQVLLVSAPPSYALSLPHDYTSIIDSFYEADIQNLPIGTYIFNVVNNCGNSTTLHVEIVPSIQVSPVVLQSCEMGYGSIKVFGDFVSVQMTSAPSSYPHTMPYNLTSILINSSCFTLDSLPEGTYTFQSVDSCGNIINTNVNLVGYHETNTISIIPHCGSFDINLNHTSNTTSSNLGFWLQKFNSATNTWGHPLTGVVYTPGSYPTSTNSIPLINGALNLNFTYTGHFRILKAQTTFVTGNGFQQYCYRTLYEFDYTNAPKIVDVYSVACGNTFEVVVDAEGIPPLQYRITTKNGMPFIINNGNSNVFTGLEPATYNFQVEDACGTILNSVFQVVNPNPMQISSSGSFCNGQNTSLSVPNFNFLNYRWWREDNPSITLSTSNSLNFTPFNSALHSGLYHVQISYVGNPNSCLNQVLDYSITASSLLPNAGGDNTISFCGNQGTINLFSLLQGSYDNGGIWTETTGSGTLANSNWNATGLFGNYQFKYRVEGLCNQFDEAFINITINPVPIAPTASSVNSICSGHTLNLFATTIPNAVYHWSGPNGFTSTMQNPVINSVSSLNSGAYTVYVSQNGCNSPSSSTQVSVITAVAPNAGSDNTIAYCGGQSTINLFSLIQGSYDAGGTWTETTSSGTLSNNNWNATGLFGTYQFKYRVDGQCNLYDEANITISIKPIPQTPIATTDSVVCSTYNLNLYATTIPNANYFWTGPNGFTSSAQNPMISSASNQNSGVYSVYVIQDGCQSAVATANVMVNNLPEFTVLQYCSGLNYTLEALPVNNTFNIADATYSWTGPNNFSSTQNPTIITQLPTGIYNLTVTDSNGCSNTTTVDVLRTICFIPNAITPNDDGSNDEFNLTGFEVAMLKIYNRWGRMVYDKEDYANEWQGQNNKGDLLPEGTYYYIISFKNNKPNKTGWIYLGR